MKSRREPQLDCDRSLVQQALHQGEVGCHKLVEPRSPEGQPTASVFIADVIGRGGRLVCMENKINYLSTKLISCRLVKLRSRYAVRRV